MLTLSKPKSFYIHEQFYHKQSDHFDLMKATMSFMTMKLLTLLSMGRDYAAWPQRRLIAYHMLLFSTQKPSFTMFYVLKSPSNLLTYSYIF